MFISVWCFLSTWVWLESEREETMHWANNNWRVESDGLKVMKMRHCFLLGYFVLFNWVVISFRKYCTCNYGHRINLYSSEILSLTPHPIVRVVPSQRVREEHPIYLLNNRFILYIGARSCDLWISITLHFYLVDLKHIAFGKGSWWKRSVHIC